MKNKHLIFLLVFFGVFTISTKALTIESDNIIASNAIGEKITDKSIVINDTITKVVFNANIDVVDNLTLTFWVLPSKNEEGNFYTYPVEINGVTVDKELVPIKIDWHSVTMDASGFPFKIGSNQICIIGSVPDIPSIEYLKIDNTKRKVNGKLNSLNDDENYTNYKKHILLDISNNKLESANKTDYLSEDSIEQLPMKSAPTGEIHSAINDYDCYIGAPLYYTFFKNFIFYKGDTVYFSTEKLDNFAHIIEVFNTSSPNLYSWTASCATATGGISNFKIEIPITGAFCVRVRSYKNARLGLCNLTCNRISSRGLKTTYAYDSIPLYSLGFVTYREDDQEYNYFTCKNTGDPAIFLESYYSPGKICAYNDNYKKNGNFNWGKNARIRGVNPCPVRAILASTAISSEPYSTCDIYAGCKTYDKVNNHADNLFNGLDQDDAIQSYPIAVRYNCFSWSVGVTDGWNVPDDNTSVFKGDSILESFDNFYNTFGFTRLNANWDNAPIDLYGYISSKSNKLYLAHASIRKGADNHTHGYDWESKLGGTHRIFHPRTDISCANYGTPWFHYIKTNQNSSNTTFLEKVESGELTIEYYDLNLEEENIILNQIHMLNSSVLSNFNTLYEDWSNIVHNTIHSNFDMIISCEEYDRVIKYIEQNPSLKYCVFEKVANREIAAVILMNYIDLPNKDTILKEQRTSFRKKNSQRSIPVYRSIEDNQILFIKRYIANEKKIPRNEDEHYSSYNNTVDFKIYDCGNQLMISFDSNIGSKASIKLCDEWGSVFSITENIEVTESGHNSFYLPKPNDASLVFVVLTIDNHINVKKFKLK